MYRVVNGYAGGTTSNPAYLDIGDHSEAIYLEYNPEVVPYEKLLDVFFKMHDATREPASQRSLSIIFYYTEEQKAEAQARIELEAVNAGRPVVTILSPASDFHPALDYFQQCGLDEYRAN